MLCLVFIAANEDRGKPLFYNVKKKKGLDIHSPPPHPTPRDQGTKRELFLPSQVFCKYR